MAVTRAGVGQRYVLIPGVTTSGTVDLEFNVNPAAENTYGIVAVGFTCTSDISGASFGVDWGDDAMTEMLDAPLMFNSDKCMLMGWIIADPSGGEVHVSYSDVPTGAIKNLFAAAVMLEKMEDLDLDNLTVETEVGSTNVTSSGVTVASGVPADRVISVHLIGMLNAFTSFSGTRVAAPLSPGGGHMILGESRGATSVDATVTHALTTANWAAFGIHTDAAPLTDLGFSGDVRFGTPTFGADLYRFSKPHPDRDYLVPGVNSADPTIVADRTVVTANGVPMPVWVKDPDDTLDFTLRWNNHLAPNDEIRKVEHTTTGSLRIISEAIDPDNPAVTQFWAKGATRGVTHPVRIRWWTKSGRQQDFTVYIAAENN